MWDGGCIPEFSLPCGSATGRRHRDRREPTRALERSYFFGLANSLVVDEPARRSLLYLSRLAGDDAYDEDATIELGRTSGARGAAAGLDA